MFRTIAIFLLAILFFSCSSTMPKLEYTAAEIKYEFQKRLSPQELAAVEIPFFVPDSFINDLTQKMRYLSQSSRLNFIMDYLVTQNHFHVKYAEGETNTASEVLQQGKGNCIALSHLLIGITRKFGIPSNYVYILNNPTFSFYDHTISINYHVMVAVENGPEYRFYDFQPGYSKNFLSLNGVNDLEGIALHYNNLGAENLQKENYDKANIYLSIANKLAPENSEILSNYGLYFIRTNNLAKSKELFMRATTLDKTCYPAWHNLLYITLRENDKKTFNTLRTELENVNSPTIKLFLANMAYQEGAYNTALDYLSQINPEMTKLFIVYLLEAQAYYKLGKFQYAKNHLMKYTVKNPDDLHAHFLENELKKVHF